jgi:hypothetical protein
MVDFIRDNAAFLIVLLLAWCVSYLHKISDHLFRISKSVDREYQERAKHLSDLRTEK